MGHTIMTLEQLKKLALDTPNIEDTLKNNDNLLVNKIMNFDPLVPVEGTEYPAAKYGAGAFTSDVGSVTYEAPVKTTLQTATYKKKYDNNMVMKIASELLAAEVTKNGLAMYSTDYAFPCKRAIALAKAFIDEMGL